MTENINYAVIIVFMIFKTSKQMEGIMKAFIVLVMTLFLSVVLFSCESSSDDKSSSKNLTGWWSLGDNSEWAYIEHDAATSTVILNSPFGEAKAAGPMTGSIIAWNDLEGGGLITATYHSDGEYIDGNDPHGDYFRFNRSINPFVQLQSRSIIIDGDISDWRGISPQITDPGTDRPDCAAAADIENVRVCRDGSYLVFLVNLEGDATFPHSGYANDKYQIRINCPGDQEYTICIMNTRDVQLYNENTGVWTSIGSPGISYDKMECRLNLGLIGNPEKVSIYAGSWSDHIMHWYDETGSAYFNL